MSSTRPHANDVSDAPVSAQNVLRSAEQSGSMQWIGPADAHTPSEEERTAYDAAQTILRHLCIRAPLEHGSGHPGGPLSASTFTYALHTVRDPAVDQPLRYSAGHLSLLAYGMQWLFGRQGSDERLQSIESIIQTFRTPDGLPGHVEAGIGDIPFGTGPLGKGVSNAAGVALGLRLQQQPGMVDVLLADGDAQEGQVMEAFRFASTRQLDNLVVHADMNDMQLSDVPSRTMAPDLASMAHAAGWNVIEVQNGNDYGQVLAALQASNALQKSGHPTLICYYTVMGYGIDFMEEASNTGTKNFHGSPLTKEEAEKALSSLQPLQEAVDTYQPYRAKQQDRATNRPETDRAVAWDTPPSYERSITQDTLAPRKAIGAVHLLNLMRSDPRIIVLHADLAGSGGFDKVQKEFADRVINTGVAEANMYMVACGLRQTGLLPVTYTFAAFGVNEARANARLIDINCGHTRCGVLHDCTHAGVSVGEDGETHQEQNYFTLPFRHTQVWMSGDANQAGAMTEYGLSLVAEGHQSVYIFSPRTDLPQIHTPEGKPYYDATYRFDGKADIVRGTGTTKDVVTIVATGAAVHAAIQVADSLANAQNPLHVRVLHVACIRPLDAAAIIRCALETRHIIVAEDHNIEGGLASQVADVIADFQLPCSLRRIGLSQYFPSGKAEDLIFFAGLDAESMEQAVLDEVRSEVCGGEDAFVTAIMRLRSNMQTSRFRETAQPFIDHLIESKSALDALRAHWASLTCPPDQLPSNERLRQELAKEMRG